MSAPSLWRKFRVLFATQFASMAEYRAEIIIWMFSGTLSLVMMLVWMAQADAAPGGQVRGYSPAEFAGYFLSIWVVSQLMVVWVSWEIDYAIRQGQLSPQLLRPLDPIWPHFIGHVTERFVRALPMFALVSLFTLLTGAKFTTQWWAYPAAFGLVTLGFTARFLWEYTLGLLAFWTENTTSFQEVVWLIYAALGGMLAPLTFLPDWAQTIARCTPFPYMLGLPAQLLTGKATPEQALQGAAVLAGWLVLFWFVRLWVWRRGLRRYGAVGA